MHWDVKTVKPLPEYRLYVEIEDGRRGIFDMKPYLERGVFRELKDEPMSGASASSTAP
jgi:Protein of unknown function (DUF2442)